VQVQATTARPLDTGADTIVVGLFEGGRIEHDLPAATLQALVGSGEARGELGRVAVAHGEGRRVIVVGLGPEDAFGPETARRAAAAAHGRARELAGETLCWEVPPGAGPEVVRGIVEGTLLHAYRFDRYSAPDERPEIDRLIISGTQDFAAAPLEASIITGAQNRARDLGNTPANDLSPAGLAEYAQVLGGRHDRLAVTVLDGEAIRDAGMGAFAAVAQGSARGARLIQLEYEGVGSEGPGSEGSGPRLALVGKGVTFDSGGLSLKPPQTMYEMKFDMCGAAAVIEAIAALAELEAPVRVLGVVGATENLPSGTAVKPGDIVRALDGTTIEVNNTDAEGRLVLADCLCHALREGCEQLIDIATLTGGIVVALGSKYAGMMSNDEAWAELIQSCAAEAGEPVWRMPLHPDYAAMVKGRYAQLTNMSERREATPITGAELLHHFVAQTPWAHIDIAGTAWDVKLPYLVGKGATGYGVRLLVPVAPARAGERPVAAA
jgi:leucyl aminopeptidase